MQCSECKKKIVGGYFTTIIEGFRKDFCPNHRPMFFYRDNTKERREIDENYTKKSVLF